MDDQKIIGNALKALDEEYLPLYRMLKCEAVERLLDMDRRRERFKSFLGETFQAPASFPVTATKPAAAKRTDNYDRTLAVLRKYPGGIPNGKIRDETGVPRSSHGKVLVQLEKDGLARRDGAGTWYPVIPS